LTGLPPWQAHGRGIRTALDREKVNDRRAARQRRGFGPVNPPAPASALAIGADIKQFA
jgi:hypothetical protein